MCLYPKLIKNPKYKANKKNGGNVPDPTDKRALYVPIGCGKCMECMKQKANNWKIRLHEEIRDRSIKEHFVTLSYSDESLINLQNDVWKEQEKVYNELLETDERLVEDFTVLDGYDMDNAIAKLSVKRFRERWRKKFKKSIKHWLVTELGQNNTERLHLHGILWTDHPEEIEKIWKYGNIWIGSYVNEKTINYIVKYIHKTDEKHKHYNPIVLTSPGVGSNYLNRPDSKNNKYQGENTKETYTMRNGAKIGLPIYYRNKLYTEEEREKLWMNLLDKEVRYVNGIKVDISKNEIGYEKLLKKMRLKNIQLGYPDIENADNDKAYEKARRELKRLQLQKKVSKLETKSNNNLKKTNT